MTQVTGTPSQLPRLAMGCAAVTNGAYTVTVPVIVTLPQSPWHLAGGPGLSNGGPLAPPGLLGH